MNSRLVRPCAAALLALVPALACSDSSTGPNPAKVATQAADNFDHVADSLVNVGNSDDAASYQALADLIRVIGRVDQVVVKVDGRSVTHNAIGFEILVPESACASSSDPALCRANNPAFAQIIYGWTGTNLKENFIVYSEQTGSASAGDPGSGPYPPGFVSYSVRSATGADIDLFGAASNTWYSYDGSVTTQAGTRGTSCTMPGGNVAGETCHLAQFSPAFDVTASEDYSLVDAPTTRHLTMSAQRVDGVSLDETIVNDGTLDVARAAVRRDRALTVRALLRRVSPALLRVPAAAR